MKALIFIFCVFLQQAFAQFHTPGTVAAMTYPPIQNTIQGLLFSDDFNRASLGANWSISNSANITVSGNSMVCVGAGDVTHWASYTAYPFQGENWTITWQQWISVTNASSYGLCVGIRSMDPIYGTGPRSYAIEFSTASVNKDKLVLFDSGFNAISSTGHISPPTATNDVMLCSLSFSNSWLLASATNTTRGGSVSLVTNALSMAQSYLRPFVRYVTVWPVGGTTYVDNLSLSNSATVPGSALLIGNSISDGYYSSNVLSRFFSVMQSADATTIYNCSASSDMTSTILSVMPQLLSYSPSKVYLMIGGNDVLNQGVNGELADTWKTNYLNITSNFTGRGISVYHLLPTPRNGTDLRPLTNFISTSYAAGNVIDTWSPLLSGNYGISATYDSGDGTHPNAAGHLLIGQTITNSGKFP